MAEKTVNNPAKMRKNTGSVGCLLLLCLFLLDPAAGFGQEASAAFAELGNPLIQNFSPRDYNFFPQNWAIVQNDRGVLFIGNTLGMLEYDGVRWRQHQQMANTGVYTLTRGRGDTLYAGGRGNMGYFVPDETGQLRYFSLQDSLPEAQRTSGELIWEAFTTAAGIYFRSRAFLYRWDGKSLRYWQPDGVSSRSFLVRDTLYLHVKGQGLLQMRGDSLWLLPGSERLGAERVYLMLPFPERGGRQMLVGSRESALLRYDGARLKPFVTGDDAMLLNSNLQCGILLDHPEPLWAIGTQRNGVVLVDTAGQIRQVINRAAGLIDDKVHHLYQDKQGGIWASLNNGLARIEAPAPFSVHDETTGLQGTIYALSRYQGTFYAATSRGVFALIPASANPYRPAAFEAVEGISNITWALLPHSQGLLAGGAEGVYEIVNRRARLIARTGGSVYCLAGSQVDPQRVYAGTVSGLGILQQRGNRWEYPGKVAELPEEVRSVAEDSSGAVWLGTQLQGALRLEIDPQNPLQAEIRRFGEAEGILEGMANVYPVNGGVRLGTYHALRRYDPASDRLLPDSSLGAFLANEQMTVHPLVQGTPGRFWAMAGVERGQLYAGVADSDGVMAWDPLPFRRLTETEIVLAIHPDPDGVVWFAGREEKLYRYDPALPKDYRQAYPALVRRVSRIRGDSLLWNGAAAGTSELLLPYRQNSLRVDYAATSFDALTENRFQVMLEGYDDDWLDWTGDSRKEYTGLPPGKFTFRVQAKNIYGQLSEEGRLRLTILPPWYRTHWAYVCYALLAAGAVMLIVKSRVRYLENRTAELEAQVEERTGQIRAQNEQIRAQAEKLREADQAKSRFFANISHEFRTPLTLILGPLESMLEKARDQAQQDALRGIRQNASRLLQLVNQLLDLSRLESGKLALRARPGDIVTFIKGLLFAFESYARERNIELVFADDGSEEGPADVPPVYYDPDKLEKILLNLLSNAFKFTPDGGKVHVTVVVSSGSQSSVAVGSSRQDEHTAAATATATSSSGEVIITIRDSGIGIAPERIGHIFDRFYQVDDSSTRAFEGTGIGLALVKELVELHHGEIGVRSNPGKGTAFTVRLPLGSAHLAPDEIVSDERGAMRVERGAGSVERRGERSSGSVTTSNAAIPALPSEPSAEDAQELVLIVEDHPEVRQFIRDHLAGQYQVLEAANGRAGLEMAREAVPDLVISDIMMPEMDGFQFCQTLKSDEKTSHIPVILLTAKAGEESRITGLETGADDYLTKPFNARELLARVRNLIDLRRSLRRRFSGEMLLQPQEVAVTSQNAAFLTRALNLLETHLEDEQFGVKAFSEALGMTERQLQRKLRALVDQSPNEFIRIFRLQRARQLLEQNAGSVSEIAYRVGFNNLSYFAKSFREQFGKLPSEWKSED